MDYLGKKVISTKTGQLLHKYELKLLKLSDAAEIALTKFDGDIKGQIVISGSIIPIEYILLRIIRVFVKKSPLVC